MPEYLKGAAVGLVLGAIAFMAYAALTGQMDASAKMKPVLGLLTFGGAAIGAIVALLMQRALERELER